jgi:DNA-binding transcriptional ArsR family regulator
MNLDGVWCHIMGHSPDAYLRLLADQHRRLILRYLRSEADGTTTFADLVARLGGGDRAPGSDRPRDPERIAIQLEHTHLPTLADHGVVEYDRRSGAVRYQSDEQVEALLDSLPEDVSVPNP